MKLQLSLIMIAALATADEATADVKPEPVPSVWNNWNGRPDLIPESDDYFIKKDYFNQPLNKEIDHSFSSDPLAGKCHAIQQDPIPAPNNQEQVPRFCRFGGYTQDWNRCCHGLQDGKIELANRSVDLWPAECQYNHYEGLGELTCAACHEDQPKWTYYDPEYGVKVVRVCKSVLARFYNDYDGTDPVKAKLDEPTAKFEQCGAWKQPDAVLEESLSPEGKYDGTFHVIYKDPYIVFPEGTYANADEFYQDFDQAQLPFLWDFRIMAVDDFDAEGNRNVCFKGASSLAAAVPVALAAVVLNFLA